jgi:hypothetical protein
MAHYVLLCCLVPSTPKLPLLYPFKYHFQVLAGLAAAGTAAHLLFPDNLIIWYPDYLRLWSSVCGLDG